VATVSSLRYTWPCMGGVISAGYTEGACTQSIYTVAYAKPFVRCTFVLLAVTLQQHQTTQYR
jgi:hypothetical protein